MAVMYFTLLGIMEGTVSALSRKICGMVGASSVVVGMIGALEGRVSALVGAISAVLGLV